MRFKPEGQRFVFFLDSPKTPESPICNGFQNAESAPVPTLPDAYAPLNADHISGLGEMNL